MSYPACGDLNSEGGGRQGCPYTGMKRRFFIGLIMCLALACIFGTALAAYDPLKVSMDLSQTSFTDTKSITVSITVSNAGEGDMPGPVTLYYPNGKQVTEFGSPTLKVGDSQTWSGTWKVTQKQLEAGKITFKIKYSVYNDNGELVNKTKNFSRKITYTATATPAATDSASSAAGQDSTTTTTSSAAGKVQVEINRTITPMVASKGKKVSVVYEVVNSGEVDITDVKIKENSSISKTAGSITSVKAGERATYTFTVTMGSKDLTSQATITYKANGKTETAQKEQATIQYGEVNLTASLAADKKGGMPGDIVTLTLTLKNTGSVDYNAITVTDPTLGTVFQNESLAAGKKLELKKEVTITDTADYLFTVKAISTAEVETTTTTELVNVTAISAEDQVNLSVTAESDRDTIYAIPGTVKFTVTVTNNGQNAVQNVTVSASGVKLYSFPTIQAGESRSFTRDISVSMAGQYQFQATSQNVLQETVSFDSNIIPIAYAQPTAVPTAAPIVTPPQPVHEDIPTDDGLPAYVDTVQSALNVVWILCAVLGAVSLALLIAGLVRRAQQNAQSSKAYDHLERGSYRDYNAPAPKEKGKVKADKSAAEEPGALMMAVEEEDPFDVAHTQEAEEDETGLPAATDADTQEAPADDAQEGVLEQTMQSLYPRTGGRRIMQTAPSEEAAAAEEKEPEAEIEAPAAEAPRRRRSDRHYDN